MSLQAAMRKRRRPRASVPVRGELKQRHMRGLTRTVRKRRNLTGGTAAPRSFR